MTSDGGYTHYQYFTSTLPIYLYICCIKIKTNFMRNPIIAQSNLKWIDKQRERLRQGWIDGEREQGMHGWMEGRTEGEGGKRWMD